MTDFNVKYALLKDKIESNESVRIMIFGLGSVGSYLLDYLLNLSNPKIEIIVVGRYFDKLSQCVNIIKVAATIRGKLRSNVIISLCDFNNISSIEEVLYKYNPSIIVNSSRFYSGVKYGGISWGTLRSYGIWAPLAVQYAKNIMIAYGNVGSKAITINTSYSDAVIPWLKSAGLPYFDFGSGNLNHLIPRMKIYIAQKFNIDNINDIDITIATSHFHDVVISKEGHSEGQKMLLDVKVKKETLMINHEDLLKACAIPMPTDQKRNMMNASSNFAIIEALLCSIKNNLAIKVHSPGVCGLIGGYPYVVDATHNIPVGYVDESVFILDKMIETNRNSIYLDGVEDVALGCLKYTDELLRKVNAAFGVSLPKSVPLEDSADVSSLLINEIILKNVSV